MRRTESDDFPYSGVIIVLLFIAIAIYAVNRKNYYFSKGASNTCAIIIKFTSKDAYGNMILDYKYRVNGVDYMGYYTASYFEFCPNPKNCVGYKFKVRYATVRPSIVEADFYEKCK
jgi:hypothetical protein